LRYPISILSLVQILLETMDAHMEMRSIDHVESIFISHGLVPTTMTWIYSDPSVYYWFVELDVRDIDEVLVNRHA
jgi:hypothetical protein